MPDGALPARLTIGGVEQLFYSELDVEHISNDKAIETIPGGFVGHSNGVHMVRINGRSQIPNTGREFDFIETMRLKKTIEMGTRLAGVSREYRGRIMTAKEQSKTSDIVTIDWSFEGKQLR